MDIVFHLSNEIQWTDKIKIMLLLILTGHVAWPHVLTELKYLILLHAIIENYCYMETMPNGFCYFKIFFGSKNQWIFPKN